MSKERRILEVTNNEKGTVHYCTQTKDFLGRWHHDGWDTEFDFFQAYIYKTKEEAEYAIGLREKITTKVV